MSDHKSIQLENIINTYKNCERAFSNNSPMENAIRNTTHLCKDVFKQQILALFKNDENHKGNNAPPQLITIVHHFDPRYPIYMSNVK